jgi:predicted short-subunit dehydrogenase-like oxidoreductase (DUF2520 family)
VFGPNDMLPPANGVLIAVPDHALGACADALAPRLDPATKVVLHTSGLVPASVLRPLARKGRHLGSMHPLVSFPTATGAAVTLRGAVAAVEGDPAAVRVAGDLARALGMRPVTLTAEAKPLYHAAAAMAANLTHTLVVTAKTLLVRTGFTAAGAAAALRPLVEGAVEAALEAEGIENLTGPLGRGDASAVRAHLAALPVAAAAAYRAVGQIAAVALASQCRLSESQLQEMTQALTVLS